jgi:hypothetical protein
VYQSASVRASSYGRVAARDPLEKRRRRRAVALGTNVGEVAAVARLRHVVAPAPSRSSGLFELVMIERDEARHSKARPSSSIESDAIASANRFATRPRAPRRPSRRA